MTVTLELDGAPQQAIAELVALHNQDGSLTPGQVVEWARDNPDSALHAEFTWDDEAAAHAHRISQARSLIADVQIRVIERPEITTRAFISVTEGSHREYRLATNVMSDDIAREQYLRDLRRQIARLMDKLRKLPEFASVVAAWDTTKDGE